MKTIGKYKMIIGVSHYNPELPVILYAPDDATVGLDSIFTEDGPFLNIPKEPGVYLCEVNLNFEQGYFEGYPADGEIDWEYDVESSKLINDYSEAKIQKVL